MKFYFGAALALASASASAQHAMVLQKLEQLNAAAPAPAAKEVQEAIGATAKARAAATGACTPKSFKLSATQAATGDRAILQGVLGGQIRNGWTVMAEPAGCPGQLLQRFMLLQLPDGGLKALFVNEGRSLTSPSTMRDTSMSAALLALTRAKAANAACDGKDLDMLSSRVASESPDLGKDIYGVRYTGSWTEVWRFRTCGKSFDVPVEFRPDGDGGAYTNIKVQEVVALP